jgi:hypothetical protein
MNREPPACGTVSRPTGLDYLFLLLGCSLSLFLLQISGPLAPEPKDHNPSWLNEYVLPILPAALYLPQGVILLWPIFYSTQRLRGRPQALSAGEWLWGVAWLGTVLLTAWGFWRHFGSPPGFVEDLPYPPQLIWTVIACPAMAGVALLIGLLNLFGRWKQPWTHTFGLVLVFWPVIPLAGLLLWGERGWKWN